MKQNLKLKFNFRNAISAFTLFTNNVDINTNREIARKLGHEEDYLEAMRFFKKKGILNHNYIIIRRDVPALSTSPKCYTNMWGEIEGLEPTPYFFGPRIV